MILNVLVDYDNVERASRKKGVRYVVDLILAAISLEDPLAGVRLRLYGGWYDLSGPTKYAQSLMRDVMNDYPRIESCRRISGKIIPLRVEVEMAYSLEMEPLKHLLHTYRPRLPPDNLRCRTAPEVGCTRTGCSINVINHWVEHSQCPTVGCGVKLSDAVYRGEQKMIDAMMMLDLLFISSRHSKACVVSSDDDMLPAIRTALLQGGDITHIHTRKLSKTPAYNILGHPKYRVGRL